MAFFAPKSRFSGATAESQRCLTGPASVNAVHPPLVSRPVATMTEDEIAAVRAHQHAEWRVRSLEMELRDTEAALLRARARLAETARVVEEMGRDG